MKINKSAGWIGRYEKQFEDIHMDETMTCSYERDVKRGQKKFSEIKNMITENLKV